MSIFHGEHSSPVDTIQEYLRGDRSVDTLNDKETDLVAGILDVGTSPGNCIAAGSRKPGAIISQSLDSQPEGQPIQ